MVSVSKATCAIVAVDCCDRWGFSPPDRWLRTSAQILLTGRDQSTDIALGATKHIEIALYDRSLVGKHDLIGVAVIKLDPKSWSNGTCREAVLPLSPRGLVYLRIGVEGGDKDIKSAFAGVSRTLHRAQDEMMNDVVERMMEYLRDQLSSRTLSEMTKPKDKKKPRIGEAEMDASLGGVYHYLNTNVSSPATRC